MAFYNTSRFYISDKGETDPYKDDLKVTRLLHHLQYAKYTATISDVKGRLDEWEIVAEEEEHLLPRLGAWLGAVLGRKINRSMFRAIPSITTEITGNKAKLTICFFFRIREALFVCILYFCLFLNEFFETGKSWRVEFKLVLFESQYLGLFFSRGRGGGIWGLPRCPLMIFVLYLIPQEKLIPMG